MTKTIELVDVFSLLFSLLLQPRGIVFFGLPSNLNMQSVYSPASLKEL